MDALDEVEIDDDVDAEVDVETLNTRNKTIFNESNRQSYNICVSQLLTLD